MDCGSAQPLMGSCTHTRAKQAGLRANGLSSDQVLALFEDREGTIWVGTSEGIDRFREWPVTSLSVKQGLSNSTATSVLATRDGSIWIGTADGLNRWKDGRATIYRRRIDPGLPDDSSNRCSRMSAAASGSRDLAVLRCSRTGSLPPSRRCLAGLRTIASDNRGGLWLSLWLTSNDYGLAHLVDGHVTGTRPGRSWVAARGPVSSPTRTAASGQGF